MRHSLSRLVFLLTVVSISGSAQHVVAGPSEAIRLEMFFERAVVEDKDLFLDCGVVFFGKSSSLVRMPQHCVVEFSEMPSREVDKSGKSEVWIPGLPLDSSGLLGGPIGDQETFVVVKHSRDNKKFLRENYCSFRVRLCSVSDLEKRFRDAIATVTVELGTREFPLDRSTSHSTCATSRSATSAAARVPAPRRRPRCWSPTVGRTRSMAKMAAVNRCASSPSGEATSRNFGSTNERTNHEHATR